METLDPMCWQAWQANPSTMWNWNGTYIDGVAGDYQGATAGGYICSGGPTVYNAALNSKGLWTAKTVPNTFTVTVHDQALHGADYHHVYVTKQGFDVTQDDVAWENLELVSSTAR
uniref:Chitin_bind_3 n=1 Tax=uncultured Micromonospora sp. TaxID=429168 RepID=A0A060BZL4_9ACTN|nr:chitin_bind_3 [uncultured Micromonospora sp.]